MKKIFIPVLLIASLLIFTGCGKKSEIINAELSLKISEEVAFSEQLTELDDASAERRYSINSKDYDEITAYVGTKGTCDEYVIIKTSSPKNMTEKINKYIEKKRAEYAEYRPNEAEKLNAPVIEEYKGTIVLIVTADDENARNVYQEYLKK